MGRAIGSRYELDDEIGRGAFGAVWRGRVRATGEAVAIKVLLEEFAADADVVTRFLRERAALVGLNHRSLVRLRDLVVEGDILALVMQLVEGPDLKKYLAGRGRLAPDEAGLLVAEVAEGMAVAHSAGIVHRDIKPANVLLEQADGGLRPLLTDFGIARIADAPSVTRTHQVVGTPYYLAPEVVAGKKATPAADVYAAGIMVYELITGHPVFRGPDAVSVFRQHMNTVPERPAEIPQRLWPVIAAALVKEPEARPSATVLAAQLRAAIGRSVEGPDGEPTHHLPVEGQYGTLRLPPMGRPSPAPPRPATPRSPAPPAKARPRLGFGRRPDHGDARRLPGCRRGGSQGGLRGRLGHRADRPGGPPRRVLRAAPAARGADRRQDRRLGRALGAGRHRSRRLPPPCRARQGPRLGRPVGPRRHRRRRLPPRRQPAAAAARRRCSASSSSCTRSTRGPRAVPPAAPGLLSAAAAVRPAGLPAARSPGLPAPGARPALPGAEPGLSAHAVPGHHPGAAAAGRPGPEPSERQAPPRERERERERDRERDRD